MNNTPRAQAALRFFKKHDAWMEDRIESGIEANRKGWLFLGTPYWSLLRLT